MRRETLSAAVWTAYRVLEMSTLGKLLEGCFVRLGCWGGSLLNVVSFFEWDFCRDFIAPDLGEGILIPVGNVLLGEETKFIFCVYKD